MEIKRFRSRPTVVEAVRFTRESRDDLAKWTDGRLVKAFIGNREIITLSIINPSGVTATAKTGDWIVRGPDGSFFTLTPEQFNQGYDIIL